MQTKEFKDQIIEQIQIEKVTNNTFNRIALVLITYTLDNPKIYF